MLLIKIIANYNVVMSLARALYANSKNNESCNYSSCLNDWQAKNRKSVMKNRAKM